MRTLRALTQLLLLTCLAIPAIAALTADSAQVAAVENIYADVSDAKTIIQTIDSGLVPSYQGKDRAAWRRFYQAKRRQLARELSRIQVGGLSAGDSQAVAAMRAQLESFPESLTALFAPTARCADAQRKDLNFPDMRAALVDCFVEGDKHMQFEGKGLNRQAALDLFHELNEPERRKAVFMAFLPVWKSMNGNNQPDSPYRRLIAMAAADAARNGSEVDHAARDVGATTAEVEHWLEQVLEAWRVSTSDQPVEPWSFSYQGAEADRALADAVPLASLKPINQRFYQDLGADLEKLGVLYDLDARPGKASLAYTEYVIHGRMIGGVWRPAMARVSAPYEHGGLFVLNELVHENGHVINITAVRNRPAFSDWPSDLFAEAFADVPAWSTYEPAWQKKYLGKQTSGPISLRALYSVVILDVAWSLFELRMLRDPSTDPNALWTEITSHYLHIVPHPEFSWWALRVQLMDSPGYMVNYGLGAVLTAEMRQHIREALGPFDTGDPRWYGWLGEHLLQYGSEHDTPTLMKDFLRRPVSPQALLDQIRRLR